MQLSGVMDSVLVMLPVLQRSKVMANKVDDVEDCCPHFTLALLLVIILTNKDDFLFSFFSANTL